MLTPTTPLRDIVLERPSTIALLEELHLDFCCDGARPLEEACAARGLDARAVLEVLRVAPTVTAGTPSPWRFDSAAELIELLVMTHHRTTREAIAMLQPLMAKVLQSHERRHPELAQLARTFDTLCNDLEPHMLKEELVLFPALRAIERGEQPALPVPGAMPLARMRAEHHETGALLRRLATLTDDYRPPDEASRSWVTLYRGFAALAHDLRVHIHLENNVLFVRFGS